ncbi:hypothetical protein Rctr71_016 [Virus Rctr71]|nr:hypothetical protein Rctr71_016 [Virus Rctr71]
MAEEKDYGGGCGLSGTLFLIVMIALAFFLAAGVSQVALMDAEYQAQRYENRSAVDCWLDTPLTTIVIGKDGVGIAEQNRVPQGCEKYTK